LVRGDHVPLGVHEDEVGETASAFIGEQRLVLVGLHVRRDVAEEHVFVSELLEGGV
jgi:hypothetical protein